MTNTNWTEHTWEIQEEPPDRSTDPIIRQKNAANRFTLVAVPDEAHVLYYIIAEKNAGGMNPCWKTAKFFPRGASTSQVWDPGKLPRLPEDRKKWVDKKWIPSRAELKALQQAHTPHLRRLEGDFLINGNAHAVTLWIVEGAIAGKNGPQALLVIDRRDHSYPINQPLGGESGTGTGDPK